jgi:hypothetical protein
MKKPLLLLFLAAFISLPGISQVKFGVKVGAATSTVPTYDFSTGANNIHALDDAAWGFSAGVFLRLGMGPVYLQPEIDFTTNNYEYNVQTATANQVMDQRFNRLEIPVLLGVKLGPVRLNAGPSATVPIGRPRNLLDDDNFDDMYRGTTIGFQAGVGVDIFNTITLDARYGGSLAQEFGDDVTIGDQTFNLDHRQPYFGLSLGVMF